MRWRQPSNQLQIRFKLKPLKRRSLSNLLSRSHLKRKIRRRAKRAWSRRKERIRRTKMLKPLRHRTPPNSILWTVLAQLSSSFLQMWIIEILKLINLILSPTTRLAWSWHLLSSKGPHLNSLIQFKMAIIKESLYILESSSLPKCLKWKQFRSIKLKSYRLFSKRLRRRSPMLRSISPESD